jgi:hypothetical protein
VLAGTQLLGAGEHVAWAVARGAGVAAVAGDVGTACDTRPPGERANRRHRNARQTSGHVTPQPDNQDQLL